MKFNHEKTKEMTLALLDLSAGADKLYLDENENKEDIIVLEFDDVIKAASFFNDCMLDGITLMAKRTEIGVTIFIIKIEDIQGCILRTWNRLFGKI